MSIYKLHTDYAPSGDQPAAIQKITENIRNGVDEQVLRGVTGSGKTFTIANVIKNFDRPVIVLSHNKTLASQLYSELKSFFPENAVEYFISYFDYFRPEAYLPTTDTYIEKDSKTNEQIEILRLSALNSLTTRKDVIVVASVSAIYGALNPEVYRESFFPIFQGQEISIKDLGYKLIEIQYARNDIDLKSGTFSVKGDLVWIQPADKEDVALRISFFGDQIDEIALVDPLTKDVQKKVKIYTITPATEYATGFNVYEEIIPKILKELDKRVVELNKDGKLLESTRLNQRVKNDVDDMAEFGQCKGIENYSMYLDKRDFGERPFTILDYFPKDSLMFIDESHMFIPQLNAMYKGDRSRKEALVDYGFRLPSALENRPLKFDEWETDFKFKKVFISATPGDYEIDRQNEIIPLYVRPTGLLDPEIIIRPTKNQVEDIYNTIIEQRAKNERTIILTVTKRMAEELSTFLIEKGIKAAYIHSEHNTFVRNEILRKLRLGIYEVVVGINLLREGIDLPEVSKVLVLDADKESFMRNTRSLIQIVGRAARNASGQAILYADKITKSMQECIEDNQMKRKLQIAYNIKNKITPQTIIKAIPEPIHGHDVMNAVELLLSKSQDGKNIKTKTDKKSKEEVIKQIKEQMNQAAKELDYERAIELRDILLELQNS
ncbi:excinuclease ABC subunit UvrB [Mycoplasmopsis gallopavonis]|uniref:UvrABC system protein B n=1 Tax=Mycoplasmopsis gallopavonis TaxID=76629 RepID=A0A449AYL8_9BACT|nr:excinuclease ABC subunit UvrB [Mycoplasmopsis gallopavonis]RIV16525.1 excinuclease ABC subunit UvrB [Mycoplasmopsis gallopavonis]VEU72577.1 excinuclease UvrABC system, helicase subunit (UvrB) [Mycoplasmopsis gallopavonis]